MSIKFMNESASVNASACEFLELLIQYIEDPKVSIQVAEIIFEEIILVMYHAVKNKDYIT